MSFSRDLERYAGLFASRTRVMKSSAMRDLMAITARPEVISLAGGLPDTSTFPPESFAAATRRIAEESCARALQYGPTEGLDETKACIVEAMAAEGMRVDGDLLSLHPPRSSAAGHKVRSRCISCCMHFHVR